MNAAPVHRLFAAQLAKVGAASGEPDLDRLGQLVSDSYAAAERERRRANRALGLMAEELENANERLREVVATLQVQNGRFEAALENMSLGIAMYDAEERLVVANTRLCEVLCVPPGSLRVGMTFSEVVAVCTEAHHFSETRASEVYEFRRRVFAAGSAFQFEEPRGRNIVAVTTRALDGGGCILTFEDMTERRRAEAQVEHMARHDALTGLANRTLLRGRLEEALARASRGESFAVLYLDLDRFKAVNDTLGHPVGDELLRAVTARLRASIREVDTAARLGGDEFAVVQASLHQPQDATVLARRLIEELSRPYEIQGQQLVVGTSIGIALAPEDGASADVLLKHADLALYRAKSEGRGTWRFFEREMDAQMQARRRLELDLRRALAEQEFQLLFQPLVHVGSRRIIGFEALVRWHHPERGLISPAEFIPLAEETGLIMPLGEWVLHTACREAASWPEQVSVAVNVSAVQFRSPLLVDAVAAALRASGLPGSRLEIEVTESIMLQDNVATLAILHRLHGLGVRISMDDFGTGYSSLSYLRSFPFDKIKIDQSFVRDLDKQGDARAIVSAISGLGRSLGMSTTAEGVETQEQFEQLRADGCLEAQGYLFGRPMPARDASALLRHQRAVQPAG
ncbi:EAL domain-containing protein [Paeniroseomonas aquatica]|uniref:EAL domain-containing protein n=1 Tax=Paeniroseomonas aquatica TaxID=373043 RepID=A0ABT8AFD0_9PROT|nr:EAL domain-containing protein [Paeniroseomonas aquatica]MDN3568532.1 EAL domain-containing protein [Paeniroseomonas aquatica]